MTIKINSLYVESFPPFYYLEQVAEFAAVALLTYIRTWRLMDDNYQVVVQKSNTNYVLGIDRHKFVRNLYKLNALKLLNFTETKHHYYIELTGWQNEEELDAE